MFLKKSSLTLGSILLFASQTFASAASVDQIQVRFGLGAGQLLQTWTTDDFRKTAVSDKPTQKGTKTTWVTSHEKDPATGKTASFEGVALSGLVERLLEQVPLEQRAGVDLVVLRGHNKEEVFVPRWLVTRYPVLLSVRTEGEQRTFQTVVPWTTKPAIANEGLPLERYFVRDVAEIELTSYQTRYKPLYLSRRTDPAAVRGEKIFVQNCMGCHAAPSQGAAKDPALGQGVPSPVVTFVSKLLPEPKTRSVASGHHPSVTGYSTFNTTQLRALGSYLNAFRSENPALGAGL